MGHRTLVGYVRDGHDRDGYDLHYAHWGVDPSAMMPAAPYGGAPDGDLARECARRLVTPAGGRLMANHETAVDPEPLATGLSFDELCRWLDPVEHEALYVVDGDYGVRQYLVVALRTAEGRHRTALVGYDDAADADYLRGWLAGARAVRAGSERDDGVAAAGSDPVVSALRWLDAARGTVVFPATDQGE